MTKKQCTKCGRTGGCGCLWESDTLCKKCAAQERGEELAVDLRMELEMERKKSLAAICNDPNNLIQCRICGIAKSCGLCFEASTIVGKTAICKVCQAKYKKTPISNVPAEIRAELEGGRKSELRAVKKPDTLSPPITKFQKRESDARFPDEPTLVYVAWDSTTCARGMVQRYAESIGLKYFWVNHDSCFRRTGEFIKRAAMVGIWNGNQYSGPLASKICRQRGIPHFYIENGMLPQKSNVTIDPSGFCGDSILNSDLSWVTEDDMNNLWARRADLQKTYPLRDEGFVFVPFQIHNDAQVLYHSPFNDMRELVLKVKELYPNRRIITRPHPRGGNREQHFTDVENIMQGEFLEWASRASIVVGITSTTLYEAAALGVAVHALGNHPLRAHPHEEHDRVIAGALALTVPRSGELNAVLDRFYGQAVRAAFPPVK